MPKLPDPPVELAKLQPHIRRLPTQIELWRVYFRAGKHPQVWNGFRSFRPAANARFDHHIPPSHDPDRRILYAAAQIQTCLAEVFQETCLIDTQSREPWLVGFTTTQELRLLDLSGNWPTTAGASMAINSGPRARARAWSRAIYEAYSGIQGRWYCSSMNANLPAIALHERAESALAPTPYFHRALADLLLLTPVRNAAMRLGYLVV